MVVYCTTKGVTWANQAVQNRNIAKGRCVTANKILLRVPTNFTFVKAQRIKNYRVLH
jgi:hypothetical protein